MIVVIYSCMSPLLWPPRCTLALRSIEPCDREACEMGKSHRHAYGQSVRSASLGAHLGQAVLGHIGAFLRILQLVLQLAVLLQVDRGELLLYKCVTM